MCYAVALWASDDAAAEHFNRIYSSPRVGFRTEPNALLVDAIRGLKPGKALDIGMGQGRNTVYLAQRGWDVTGFDIAADGLAAARRAATTARVTIRTELTDATSFDYGRERWDLVLLSYAWAPIEDAKFVARVRESIRPGGLVVFEHFLREGGQTVPGSPRSGELARIFAGFEVLRNEETVGPADWNVRCKTCRVVRFCARRPK